MIPRWLKNGAGTGLLIRTILLATVAALGAILFMRLIKWGFQATYGLAATLGTGPFLCLSFVFMTLGAGSAGWLIQRYSPTASGSGVPQFQAAYWGDWGHIPWRATWVRFVAGLLSLIGGASLGREGPSIYIGAGLASSLGGRWGLAKHQRRGVALVGVAAALAAAFNTPLAAVVFVIEEVVRETGHKRLAQVMLAAITGALLTHVLVSPQPAFVIPPLSGLQPRLYLLVLPVALLGGLLAGAFQVATLALRARASRLPLPLWLRASLGGWLTWLVAAAAFLTTGRIGIFGLGYDDLTAALIASPALRVALILLAAKWLATVLSYSFGLSGGIFSPSLFLGGFSGIVVAGLLAPWVALTPEQVTMLACVGMAANLGGLLRAPITSLLLVFEMTHDPLLLLPLLLGLLVSQGVIRLFGPHNFYEALLRQDGYLFEQFRPRRTRHAWQKRPVREIMSARIIWAPDLEPAHLEPLLRTYRYQRFPLRQADGQYAVLHRHAITATIESGRPLTAAPLPCLPATQSLRDAAATIVTGGQGAALVLDPDQQPIGLITLHDLIRTEISD